MIKPALIDVEITALGVIERAHFSPGPGLTVITGETGAGKTMVLSALSLLTGSRADATVVRTGSERATVVGRFSVGDECARKVNELGGEIEAGELLLSRTVTKEGKSRAAIGGLATTVSNLVDLGSELLSIHGQSANFSLLKPNKAREILDDFGGGELAALFNEYSKLFLRYNEILGAITELLQLQSTRERELARITEFLDQFEKVKPIPRESADLRERILALENADGTRSALVESLQALSDNDENISTLVASVRRSLEGATKSEHNQGSLSLVREISILVNELTSSLRNQIEELDVEPGALEEMHARRAKVQGFIKKFGDVSLEDPESELIKEAERSRVLFQQLSHGDQGIAQLEEERVQLSRELIKASRKLSKSREVHGRKLGEEITQELSQLAMPQARISLDVTPTSEGLHVTDGSEAIFCARYGSDEVGISLIPHAGATPLPINKGASGGELSRIMLAIEVVLAGKSAIPTYIFDEVDAGVGGKAAVEVGRRLSLLARHAQVLVVTHLPQVAAWADTHYSIRKSSTESVTSSDLALLSGEERANELARMMAGREDSQSAREHAQELLEFASSERARGAKKAGKLA